MKVLGLLGIARLGRVMTMLAVASSATAAAGFWAGAEWAKGRAAVAEVVDLRADATALRDAADKLRRNSVDAAQDARTAARRMDVIATQHAESLDAIDSLFVAQRDALDAHLASVEAADLLRCRIGNLGMRLWAEAAAGDFSDATDAAASYPWQPAGGLPAHPADALGRFRPGGVAGVADRGAAVPPVPDRQEQAGASGDGL